MKPAKMTDEQLLSRVAKLLGRGSNTLPDYLNDLNACRDLEAWLDVQPCRRGDYLDRRAKWLRALYRATGGCPSKDQTHWYYSAVYVLARATGRQRCEAFVEVMSACSAARTKPKPKRKVKR